MINLHPWGNAILSLFKKRATTPQSDISLTFQKMIAAIDCLRKPKEVFGFPIQFKESSVFPFEMTYRACDLQTKEEINIKSGEMIHGALINGNGFVSAYFMEQLLSKDQQNKQHEN